MIEKSPLCPERVRTITGSFAFIEHRFLRDGFWTSLSHHELLLYTFLILVADRKGLSCYSFYKPTVSPLLFPVTSRNLLSLQSLPHSIPYRQDNVRRRKDAYRVGTAARGSRERLSRLP
jgi:hypothetical protein